MRKALVITGAVAVTAGAGVWAIAGWSAIGLAFLIPVLFVSAGALITLGVAYSLLKLIPDNFKEGIVESFTEMATAV